MKNVYKMLIKREGIEFFWGFYGLNLFCWIIKIVLNNGEIKNCYFSWYFDGIRFGFILF